MVPMNKAVTSKVPALKPFALLALLLLASCAAMVPSPETPPAAVDKYVARGNEPGWVLTMDPATIDYQGDYGQTAIKVPAVTGVPSFNGMRYVTDRLTVDVTYATCADDMSGKRFADTVTVMADGKEVKGCGGRALPPESLADTQWKIVSLDQTTIAAGGKAAELRFADGKVSGSAGCNSLSGSYTVSGSAITFGPIAGTRMMCLDPQMVQETKLLSILKGTVQTRYSIEGNLIITGENGSRVTLQQVF